MEKDTYSLYNAVKKLHQIDPAKSSYTLEEYKNLTQKHYHRFHEKTGIPKYAHKNDLGEKCFTKDKYVETIFYLYAFSEPFFKNLRLFKISSYDEIESINKKYYAFLTKHMSDILTPIEIARHYELFTLRSALDETKIYEDLRSKYCDYPKIMENMINWFNPMLQNDNRKNLKQKNIATSQANTFEEISSILEEFSTPYDEKPQVPYIGLCRDVDRLFLLRKYYSAALDLYESHSAPEEDFKKQLLALNEKYRSIIHKFLEIRNAEVDDIRNEEYYNPTSNEYDDEFDNMVQEKIAHSLTSNEDTFQEALQEYWDREHRINNPITLTEEEIRATEEVLNNFFKHRNK